MSVHEDDFSIVLQAGTLLVQSQSNGLSSNLRDTLVKRLTQYYAELGVEEASGTLNHCSIEDVQLKTAEEALNVISRIEAVLEKDQKTAQGDPKQAVSSPQAIGSRDLAHVRTLISIVFKWGIAPLLSRVSLTWQTPPRTEATIIDLTNTPEDYAVLSSLITKVLSLLFPRGVHASLSPTLVCAIIVERHLVDVLVVSLTLGWLPKSLSYESTPTIDHIRPYIMRLLSLMPPSRTIEGLGSMLAFNPPPPRHAIKVCGSLLSRQLLRRDGVRALFMALFTEEEVSGESAPLDKLEQIARILRSVPAQTKPEDYFSNIGAQIVDIFIQDTPAPPPYIRASAFFLSQTLEQDVPPNQASVATALLSILHRPFIKPAQEASVTRLSDVSIILKPRHALSVIVRIMSNVDPSPVVLAKILSPIIPSLYAILECLEAKKTSNPELREAIRSLLRTWGRVVTTAEARDVVWSVVSDEGGYWKVDIAEEITRTEKPDETSSLSLLTPEDLKSFKEGDDTSIDMNLFGLRPDPCIFVAFLESIDRSDITSDLFIRLLDAYQQSKGSDDDPLRTLLYLQLINRMQSQMTSTTSSRILSDHQQALSFVKHALESASTGQTQRTKKPRSQQRFGLTLEDLRIISDDEDTDTAEAYDSREPLVDDEITVTALNLLLSLLEENEDLSAKTAPILNDIFSFLEGLVNNESENIRRLAGEARLTMTARLASTSSDARSKKHMGQDDEEDPRETYQKALKLLQDPILPVRAHGLLLLRQLMSPRRVKGASSPGPAVDNALMPAILDIFLQALKDEDSYIFLNGVQGLSAMVDGFGKDVLRGLIKIYAQGLDGVAAGNLTQHDVDVRTRIGEALSQVIQRCGDALPGYTNILVPSLYEMVRNTSLPTAVRSSALSLLATCIKTSALALIPYIEDLSLAMVDLLQLESKPVVARTLGSADEASEDKQPPETMDTDPTSKDSKLPPFRRAALHFLSLLLKASTEQIYESNGAANVFPSALVGRMRNTLRYIASTDEDAVARVMARETLEQLDSFREAMMSV
ncbi:ARM repeat-containing protein [Neolentinus lepideus HHB14362 ss-1]|uniref:ARM repeat-containing protein n=1 Tax=Neolentinus lepideus HHB14362 ss-1 TaxID=1314782 RepID=A0A165S1B1_9AGAM|nr:ARM repeat-containing protein [Neolentinus lepideus HHB14362 ss-1]